VSRNRFTDVVIDIIAKCEEKITTKPVNTPGSMVNTPGLIVNVACNILFKKNFPGQSSSRYPEDLLIVCGCLYDSDPLPAGKDKKIILKIKFVFLVIDEVMCESFDMKYLTTIFPYIILLFLGVTFHNIPILLFSSSRLTK
jgi:hypothetical protein